MDKVISLLLLLFIVTFSMPANAKRIIKGVVVDANGNPVAGYRVRAYDDDPAPDADDKMGEAITNASGRYSFQYRSGSWDGPKSKYHTSWRPDIYIVVAKPKPGGGWKRVDQTGVRKNHKLKYDITQNFRIPNDGECPYPAKFETTRVWRGCGCPSGSYKRYLDAAKYMARCADGCSQKTKCNRKCFNSRLNSPRGSVWFGYDNDRGVCVKPANLTSEYLQGYYKYFQRVSNGVAMERLPAWVINRYDRYYPNVSLADIVIGESYKTPGKWTAITDCKKIYFPRQSGELSRIRSERNVDYFWLLHEIAHADQCMKLSKGKFYTKRDRYAAMWFLQLPTSFIFAVINDGIPVSSGSIHDAMPMEAKADDMAARVIRLTGVGVIPAERCPAGTFSTRKFRGCSCNQGSRKRYKGVFNEKAQCFRVASGDSGNYPGRSPGTMPSTGLDDRPVNMK